MTKTYEQCACLLCGNPFMWDPDRESPAARLICMVDWNLMRKWYHSLGLAPRDRYYEDHVYAYITHLEGLHVRAKPNSEV